MPSNTREAGSVPVQPALGLVGARTGAAAAGSQQDWGCVFSVLRLTALLGLCEDWAWPEMPGGPVPLNHTPHYTPAAVFPATVSSYTLQWTGRFRDPIQACVPGTQRGQTGLKRRGLELRKVLRAASEETVAHPPPPRNPQLPEGVSAKHFKGKRSGAWLVVTKFWVQES